MGHVKLNKLLMKQIKLNEKFLKKYIGQVGKFKVSLAYGAVCKLCLIKFIEINSSNY